VLLTDGVSLVKGEQFRSWRTVGSVVAAARVFSMRDVDELMLLDVRATAEGRVVSPATIAAVADQLFAPLSVGGGVRTLEDFEATLRAGADKVVIGTAAIDDIDFIAAASRRFGAQAVVVAVDALDDAGEVAVESGRRPTGRNAVDVARAVVDAGAGEILLQTIPRDGVLQGMNTTLVEAVSGAVSVPVVASSGAGGYDDLLASLQAGADAVAAGAMFQFTEQTPRGARDHLSAHGIDVRMAG
jgi:imidazole glycerol-phosphate synthase subunit HisF